ncbi:SURF1 family protein [Knoellia remsis]|uniref:SURF1 family protein n=1 Tax=Knoellia remsis TaxID=407159 RepID=UPI000D07164A|nr:SURF1 family protein [Knoellia remsis]
MLESARKPRNLALLAVVVLVVVAFIQLGRWQLGVAEDQSAKDALEKARSQAPVPVQTLLRPHQDFPNSLSARPVSATGTFGADQVIVANRRLEGRTGYWVVAPLRVETTGATLPVLRGFVSSPEDAPPVPRGTVTVSGGLAPPESPYAGDAPPEGQLGSIDTSVLVGRWPGQLYNAFVFQEAESPTPAAEFVGSMQRVPTPVGDSGIRGRNAAYALQWWVFAAFALYMWWRIVREDRREDEAARAAQQAPREPGDNEGRD